MQTPENSTPEVDRLRQTTRDLIAISTLPAIWGGLHPEGVVKSLASVLLNTLHLDLVYVRSNSSSANDLIETVRSRRHDKAEDWLPALRESFDPFLAQYEANQSATIADPFGDGTLQLIFVRFGIAEDSGVVVAGSRRTDFPTEHDRLLLGVGANQAAVVVQRQRAAQALVRVTAESDRRKRLHETFLSNTPDLAYVFNLDHRFTYANNALLRMWGCTWDDAIGKNCLELGYEPWHAAMHDDEIEKVKATKLPVRGEVPFSGPLGRRVYDYIFVPVLGPNGEVEAIAGTTRDITDRKQSEEEMARVLDQVQHRAATLAKVADASRSLNLVLSEDSIVDILTQEARSIIGANQVATRLNASGDGGAEIRATSVSEAFAGRAIGLAWLDSEACADVCRTNRPRRMTPEEVAEKPDEAHAPGAAGMAVPLIGLGEKNLGLLWLSDKAGGEFTDDDEVILVQLAAIAAARIENARLYRRLREQDRRKDEFLATLAHELRNPLAPIRTGLALLKLVPSLEAAVKPREIMERQVEHMVHLIDDLLDVSRITSGKVQLKIERVDLRAVMESALELSRPQIEANRHGLFISMPKEPLIVEADATRMAQVISNLLNNAAKYTPEGGRIELSAVANGDEVAVRVQDNGVGLTPDALPKVFELFSQVGKTLDRSQGGLGIGLALVQRLVEMHDGQVSAESDGLGKGSTFLVRLPLAAKHTGVDIATQVPDAPTAPKPLRILVVDDNVDAAEMLSMVLGFSGHSVTTVHTGPGALEAAREFLPEVVFLDIGLPGMSGYEVAQQLRSEAPMRDTTLVALTGWGTEDDRRHARDAGFHHHLTKPVEIDKLQSILMQIASASL